MTELYDRYGRIVHSVVYRIVGNAGEAEEIVQEIFLRVWMRAHLIDDSRSALRPWLLTLTRNLAIDYRRKAGFRVGDAEPTSGELISAPVCFAPARATSDHGERLRRAIADLPPEQRTVIAFAYVEGMSQAEISERMGKPLGTVKTWARTALGNLRKELRVEWRRTIVSAS